MKNNGLIFLMFLLSACNGFVGENHLIEDLLNREPDKYAVYLNNPAKYRMQIVYTQINRDEKNKPHLKTYQYRTDLVEYL